jgi:hypothetical protein
MNRELILQIIQVLISVAAFIIMRYLVPAIREWMRGTQLEQIVSWTGQAVLAAEQMYSSYTGKERKVIVTQFLRKMLLHKNITLSDEELEMLIEAAVKEMNMNDLSLVPADEDETAED